MSKNLNIAMPPASPMGWHGGICVGDTLEGCMGMVRVRVRMRVSVRVG